LVSRQRLSAIYIAAASAAIFTLELGLASPRPARAEPPSVTVTLVRNGTASSVNTSATDVAGLLAEQHIAMAPGDYLSMLAEAPIQEGISLEFREARDITIAADGKSLVAHTGAPTVASALIAAGIKLGKDDWAVPELSGDPSSGIRIIRVRTWTRTESASVHGTKHVVAYRYTQIERSAPVRTQLWSHVLRRPKESAAARYAVRMIATAYVPWCYGCSGITKMGLRAGRGVVAVDPNVIPLGSRLFIPGYGNALAGDTGGAIVGNRIDLGYENQSEAMQFGRRAVTVYVLP
jgi:3D (Asp-Asp-Asp) domain-containing protein